MRNIEIFFAFSTILPLPNRSNTKSWKNDDLYQNIHFLFQNESMRIVTIHSVKYLHDETKINLIAYSVG